MVRPRKYHDLAQAAAAKAEQDRQRYLARGARIIQEQVPRFVPFMPIPGSIPPPTPAQLNLRVDIPEIIALSPHVPVDEESEFHSRGLALPYRLVTPLPLPVTALSRANEHEDDNGFDTNDGIDVNDEFDVDNGCDVNDNGEPNWRGGDHVNSEEVEQSLWPIHTVASSESDTPVAAPRTTNMRASSQSDTTPPAPSYTPQSFISNAAANEEGGRGRTVESTVAEAIVNHLAEQLYQFKGCTDNKHCEQVQEHELNYVPAKHGDIRQLTKHLQGIADEDAITTPLPDVLCKHTVMRRRSIPNCDFEQIFEGRMKREQSPPTTSVEAAVEISSTSTSDNENGSDNSDSGESLPLLGNVIAKHLALQSRQRKDRNISTSSSNDNTIATASAATSVSDEESAMPQINAMTPCLEAYHGHSRSDVPKEPSVEISFDIDSTCCFPSSLAVAAQGILAHATVNKAANLSACFHFAICDPRINENNEVVVDSVSLHQVPHYAFGQMVGLPDSTVYIFFPSLRFDVEYKTSTHLSNEDQDIWFDTILLPCLNTAVKSSNKRQHHPPSRRVADLESTAASAEGYAQKISSRQQILRYAIQPENLDVLWRLICTQVSEAVEDGMPEARFANPLLFIANKNSKLHYMESGPAAETVNLLPRAFDRWQTAWTAATDSRYYTPETLFMDIAKQTTSSDSELPPAPAPAAKLWPEVYTWKTCCLNTYLKERIRVTKGPPRQGGGGGGNYPDVAHYPFATLRDTGGLTIASRFGSVAEKTGLVYSQFYNLLKNAFDAAKVYPFENEALENLALDPGYVASLKHVGKMATTFSAEACKKSYLHSKKRTDAALADNRWRSFGTREEHRLSLTLAVKVVERWRQWQEEPERHEGRLVELRQGAGTPHFFFYSPDMFAFLRAQINRFCFMFEQVYAWLGKNHSLEEFIMMTLALRALRFSYGAGVIAAESTLYKDGWNTEKGRSWEGLGMGVAMAQCAFGWFLPKIDWRTFRVRGDNADRLVAGVPRLHAGYRRRWREVRDLGDVHMRLHQAQGWVLKYKIGKGKLTKGQPWQSDLTPTAKATAWLSYLTALNIIEFRAEIARHLLASNKKHPELSAQMATAAANATKFQKLSYSVDGMRSMFEVGGVPVTPHMATGNKSNITSSWNLIEMLFGWGEETVWKKPRAAWAKKPYRMILQKTFELVEQILGAETAGKWLHQFKLVIMVTHWVLPYVTPSSFLPLTKSNRGLGQQARTTWFSTIYVNGSQREGYCDTQMTTRWTEREEKSTLAEATRKAWLEYRMPEGSSSKDLVLMMKSAGLRLPSFGDPDTGCFQLGRRQDLTTVYPCWESGIPPQWPGVLSLPSLTILELDEYFRQEMNTADNSEPAPAPIPVARVTLQRCTPTQSSESVGFYLGGNRVNVSRQKRDKKVSSFEHQDSERSQVGTTGRTTYKFAAAKEVIVIEDDSDEISVL